MKSPSDGYFGKTAKLCHLLSAVTIARHSTETRLVKEMQVVTSLIAFSCGGI
jgi:hypothetical protein